LKRTQDYTHAQDSQKYGSNLCPVESGCHAQRTEQQTEPQGFPDKPWPDPKTDQLFPATVFFDRHLQSSITNQTTSNFQVPTIEITAPPDDRAIGAKA
jgi:hypothetical protein